MWRHVAQSLQGPSHVDEGTPCQDSHAACVCGEGESQVLVACVGDGAGSAKHSAKGSAVACQSIVDSAQQYFDRQNSFGEFNFDAAIAWCEAARERIQTESTSQGCELREMATTLSVAILASNRSCFIQIGDGAIIVNSGGVLGVVFWPQSGEYANSTNFLTAPDFKDKVEFRAVEHTFCDAALFTDGLERLALSFEQRTPHTPFFTPLFGGLRKANDVTQLERDLAGFLKSDSVRLRSDDDKTLILATRTTEHAIADC